jgi:hypothetical protein
MKQLILALIVSLILSQSGILGCSRIGPVVPEDVVAGADLIIRATAVEYAKPPANPNLMTTGEPDSIVRFRVDQTVKGHHVPGYLELSGYLVATNDFNDQPAPYKFVRPGGRRGSCFANSYTTQGEYLLILKLHNGVYTTDWYALGPTNEQLHPADDPWLRWVVKEVAGSIKS